MDVETLQKPWGRVGIFDLLLQSKPPPKKIGGLPFTLYHCRSNITVYVYIYIYILWCISYVSIVLVINGDYCKEENHWWNQFNTLLATPLQLGAAWNGGSEVV